MDKLDKISIFNYMNSGIDKSGNLKKIGGFRKHFPELYQDFLSYKFNKHIEQLPFKQKLWHYLNDNQTIPVCKVCKKPVSFLTRSGQWGYNTYCSGQCAMRDDIIKQKLDKTKEERYGYRTYNNSNQMFLTKKKRHNLNTSSVEEFFSNYLNKNGYVHKRQYKEERYPFSCDFYLIDYDVFIEINGNWTHGLHPFDKHNNDDVKRLELWKSKNTKYYDDAIHTWTISDVKKRNLAKQNNLNYLELFTYDINECIKIFEEYMKNLNA